MKPFKDKTELKALRQDSQKRLDEFAAVFAESVKGNPGVEKFQARTAILETLWNKRVNGDITQAEFEAGFAEALEKYPVSSAADFVLIEGFATAKANKMWQAKLAQANIDNGLLGKIDDPKHWALIEIENEWAERKTKDPKLKQQDFVEEILKRYPVFSNPDDPSKSDEKAINAHLAKVNKILKR